MKKALDCLDEKYKEFNQRFNSMEDGNASKRVVEKVIL